MTKHSKTQAPHEHVTRVLPAFWAPALINRDFTGFIPTSGSDSTDDLDFITRYMADFTKHYGNCDPVDVSEESFFYRGHDAAQYGVLACECFEYVFVATND